MINVDLFIGQKWKINMINLYYKHEFVTVIKVEVPGMLL